MNRLSVRWVLIQRRAGLDASQLTHRGSHCFGTRTAAPGGKVQLTLGAARYELTSGDSIMLDQPYASWENRGRSRAELLLVSARFGWDLGENSEAENYPQAAWYERV